MTDSLLDEFYDRLKQQNLDNNASESFTDDFGNPINVNVKDLLTKENEVKDWITHYIEEQYNGATINDLEDALDYLYGYFVYFRQYD